MELKVFAGSANQELAKEIAEYLGLRLGQQLMRRFSDGEIHYQISENVRGADVFLLQPLCQEVNTHIMELLIMADAFKRSSAKRITAALPYYGYARQDRKDKPRVPISAKLVADLISAAGVHRVLTMDLHAPQIQGFFNVPVDHLFAAPVMLEYIEKMGLDNVTIVSPDIGGVERARAYAKRLNANLAIVDKRRIAPNVAEVMHVIGDVRDRNTIIVDDILDTAGTMTQTADVLAKQGAARVFASCTHPVLSGPAIERIEKSAVEKVIVTNSIPLTAEKQKCKKLVVLSVAALLGEAIKRIHEETSVTSLFV
ncbi:MAG: ribose-phosphate pyrophosphokinase [Acidobacteria bacterium]|nr:ribose-phosphate pyrophosphokinase [Acidobacteriota bacterium]